MLKIKLLRLILGKSQWELGQAVGMSQTKYNLLERGFIRPSGEDARRLAQILGGSASTLFRPAFRDRKPKREMVVGAAGN